MPDMNSLYAGYREATRGLESQGAAERERVNTEYDRQRNDLQQQLGNTERDVQRALGRLRTAERREQRKRDLPNTKPRDIGTAAKLADVRQQGEDIQRSIRDTQARVESARGESVADLERQVRTEQSKLNAWYREARAIQREYQREVKAAQAAAKVAAQATAPKSTVAPAYDDAAEYYREYAPKPISPAKTGAEVFAGATAKGSVGTSAGETAFSGSKARAGVSAPIPSGTTMAQIMAPINAAVTKQQQAAIRAAQDIKGAFAGISMNQPAKPDVSYWTGKAITPAQMDARDKAINLILDVNNAVYRHTVQDWSVMVNAAQLLLQKKERTANEQRFLNLVQEYGNALSRETGGSYWSGRIPKATTTRTVKEISPDMYGAYSSLSTGRHVAGEASYPLYVIQALQLGKAVATNKALRKLVYDIIHDERGYYAPFLEKPSVMPPVRNRPAPVLSSKLQSELGGIVDDVLIRAKGDVFIPSTARPGYVPPDQFRAAGSVKYTASQAKRIQQSIKASLNMSGISPDDLYKHPEMMDRITRIANSVARNNPAISISATGIATLTANAKNLLRTSAQVSNETSAHVLAALSIQAAMDASTSGMTMPQIRQATQAAIEQMTQAVPVTEGHTNIKKATDAAIKAFENVKTESAAAVNVKLKEQTITKPDTRIRPSIAPLPETDTKTKAQQLPKVDVATKKLPEKVGAGTGEAGGGEGSGKRGKSGYINLDLPDGNSVKLTKAQYEGIVAWRQGIFYVLVYPPYGKANIIYTRKPVRGILYAKGPGSPQRSAAVVGGKLPRSFEVAMGITTLRVSPGASSKQPRLKFKARSVTPGLGEVRPSRGKKG
jgi:hypothetical protein